MSKPAKQPRRRVLVVTGSRAEFGLLRPVMDAIRARRTLELRVCVAGEHLLGPALTWHEVAKDYRIDARVPMQRPRDRGRLDHVAATGRGLTGFAAAYKKIKPDWVVVLGDRIEAFAAASAASIAGIAVCHIHGGDRAEGIADEAMRHAITKLSHLHCAATKLSAERIVRMGETTKLVHVTGSPAIDGLDKIRPMSAAAARRLGNPQQVILLHPSGVDEEFESSLALFAEYLFEFDPRRGDQQNETVLWLAPNSDAGREIVDRTRRGFARVAPWIRLCDHLPRDEFVALLKRLARNPRGRIIGNSSAGLIECAAIGLPAINIGPRQSGRECAGNVLHLMPTRDAFGKIANSFLAYRAASDHLQARAARRTYSTFGDGRAGERIARLLESTEPAPLIRKRNSY